MTQNVRIGSNNLLVLYAFQCDKKRSWFAILSFTSLSDLTILTLIPKTVLQRSVNRDLSLDLSGNSGRLYTTTLASLRFLSANSSAIEFADRAGGSGVVRGFVFDSDTFVNVSDVDWS